MHVYVLYIGSEMFTRQVIGRILPRGLKNISNRIQYCLYNKLQIIFKKKKRQLYLFILLNASSMKCVYFYGYAI